MPKPAAEAAPESSPYDAIRSAAREVYSETESTEPGARARLVRALQARRVEGLALDYAAWILLHEQRRRARGRVLTARQEGTPDVATEDVEEADSAAARWRVGAWPLRSGRKLYQATEAELREQIDLHRQNEKGNRLAAEFHEKVVAARHEKNLRPEAASSEALSEEDFVRIYESVYGEGRAA